jgi:ABC-2 type transport system permease protein
VSKAGTLTWFGLHELRLSWRDFRAMLSAGRQRRTRTIAFTILIVVAFMHFVAYRMVGSFAERDGDPDKATLIVVTIAAMLAWSMMLSQALESVTRAFYSRADLDLILSSPSDARKIFVVRIAALGASAAVTALVIAAPFVNVLAFLGGPHWLGAYVAAVAMGAAAAAFAVALTAIMFQLIGPRRTRLAAQIIAAIIGAAFVIGLQIGAIFTFGTISQLTWVRSTELLRATPGVDSIFWWPARSVLGEPSALAAILVVSMALLGLAMAAFSRRFAQDARAATNVEAPVRSQRQRRAEFRELTSAHALRLKEWTLLRRDPWLVSQSMMQLLYLLPAALLLWHSFGNEDGSLLLLVPILVMTAGQLAGGLAWLAVSGEDAPDLVATAPISPRQLTRAKIEAVLGAIALVFAPLVVAYALASFRDALVAAAGILVAAGAATAIQWWFRAQAKRSHFRRRQTSSRLATFLEAFSSIGWAATAGLAASGAWLALAPALLTAGALAGAYHLRPRAE